MFSIFNGKNMDCQDLLSTLANAQKMGSCTWGSLYPRRRYFRTWAQCKVASDHQSKRRKHPRGGGFVRTVLSFSACCCDGLIGRHVKSLMNSCDYFLNSRFGSIPTRLALIYIFDKGSVSRCHQAKTRTDSDKSFTPESLCAAAKRQR